MIPVDYISIGHITHDVVPEGFILGGPAFYSGVTAKSLGRTVGIISNLGKDFREMNLLEGLQVRYRLSEHTTTFENIYEGGRKQIVSGVADPIVAEQIPAAWKTTPIVHICPVVGEIGPELIPELISSFDRALIGIGVQGWMRYWDEQGIVHPKRWESFREILPHADVAVFSVEDIAGFGEEIVREYIGLIKILILTRGAQGSTIFFDGRRYEISAFPTREVEPTGAGDVFTAAFLIKYQETGDPIRSAYFASVAASFVVEKEGARGVPDLKQVMAREKLYFKIFDIQELVS
jgi:sugar/nucleoside kinase (ribokinase family)